MIRKKPEILAPAGTYESLEAAVKAGCDAVYAGGSFFSARAYAGNFDEAEYLKAIDFCHLHDVKLYMTLNTLLKEDEICRVPEYVAPYFRAGLDAVLVQDLGVLKVLKDHFPDLPVHSSTQMSIMSSYGAELAKQLGFERIVPARELSLEEIRSIRQKVDIEIETFVHGAMCFAYSGKCLFSSFAGGRSGNRGRCAQPCRQCYELEYGKQKNEKAWDGAERKKRSAGSRSADLRKTAEIRSQSGVHEYLMSLKDLCTVDVLPQLIDAGIDSFKIEGRMKNASYVALAVSSYRMARDLYLSLKENEGAGCYEELSDQAKAEYRRFSDERTDALRDIYNRGGFHSGYYFTGKGMEMAALQRPNHIGLRIGTVEKVKAPEIGIRLEKTLHRQDVLELIQTGADGALKAQNAGIELTSGTEGNEGQLIWLKAKELKRIRPGMDVYRTRNQQLLSEIEESILHSEKRIPAECRIEAMVGKPLKITLCSKGIQITAEGEPVLPAGTAPVAEETLVSKVRKSKGSGIEISQVECLISENAFVRMSEFNALRHQAMEELKAEITRAHHRGSKSDLDNANGSRKPAEDEMTGQFEK